MADIVINIQGQADAAVSSIDQVINRLNTLSSTLNSVAQQAQTAFASIGNIQPQGLLGFQMALNALSQQLTDLQNQIGDTASNIGNLGRQMNNVSGEMGVTRTQTSETSRTFASLGKSADKASGFFGKLLKSVGRIAFYRLLRTAIKAIAQAFSEGLKHAYAFSKATGGLLAPALDKITSASAKMKNQMGAAFGGLLTAIAPILLKIIDLCTAAAAAITRLFAILNGGGYWKQATDQVSDFGEAAGGAGGKVKGLLAAWDELNVIGNESGGGGGGGADGAEGAFEWVSVGDMLGKLFDPIEQAWNNKGKDVLDAIETALDKIKGLGETVADTLGTVWQNGTGQQTVEYILGIFQGIVETVGNLAGAFDRAWKANDNGLQIVQNIWNLFNDILGYADRMWGYIAEWADNLDLSGLLSSVADLTGSLESLVGSILPPIEDFFNNVILPVAKWAIEEGAAESVSVLAEAFKLLKSIVEPILTGIVEFAKKVSPVFETVKTVLTTAFESIKRIVEKLTSVFDEHGSRVESIFSGIATIISQLWTVVGPAIEIFYTTIFGVIEVAFTAVAEVIGTIIDILSDVVDFLAGVFTGDWERAWNAINRIFVDFWNGLVGIVFGVINGIIDVINRIGPVVSGLLGGTWTDIKHLGEAGEESAEEIASAMESAASAAKNVFTGVGDKISKDLSATPTISFKYENAPSGVGANNANHLTTVSTYAEGGYVSTGELFVAREQGPELVGSIGSHSAVANNDQIVAGISSGVQSANSEQNELLRQQNGILLKLLDKQLTISPSAALGQVVARSSALYARN